MVITLDTPAFISAVGIGNTNGTYFSIGLLGKEYIGVLSTHEGIPLITHEGYEIEVYAEFDKDFTFSFAGNGLYPLNRTILTEKIVISSDAYFIGRFAAGIGVRVGTSVAKQPGWNSTAAPRTTLSGQIVPGAGGYNYRTLSLDSRYKLGPEAMAELISGYKLIGLGYPFFIDLAEEAHKLPYSRLYATEQNQRSLSLEGGINKFLYSKRFEFTEAF